MRGIWPVLAAAQFPDVFHQRKAKHDLAKKLANLIADLIRVPFQKNFDPGSGRNKGPKPTLIFNPGIAIALGRGLDTGRKPNDSPEWRAQLILMRLVPKR